MLRNACLSPETERTQAGVALPAADRVTYFAVKSQKDGRFFVFSAPRQGSLSVAGTNAVQEQMVALASPCALKFHPAWSAPCASRLLHTLGFPAPPPPSAFAALSPHNTSIKRATVRTAWGGEACPSRGRYLVTPGVGASPCRGGRRRGPPRRAESSSSGPSRRPPGRGCGWRSCGSLIWAPPPRRWARRGRPAGRCFSVASRAKIVVACYRRSCSPLGRSNAGMRSTSSLAGAAW